MIFYSLFSREQPVLFCQIMGSPTCKFKLGNTTRDEVVSHFQDVHKFVLKSAESGTLSGVHFMQMLKRRGNTREACGPFSFKRLGDGALSPLFLLLLRTNTPPGYFSPICVQVWGPDNEIQKPKSYKAVFSLQKDKDDAVAAAKLPVSC